MVTVVKPEVLCGSQGLILKKREGNPKEYFTTIETTDVALIKRKQEDFHKYNGKTKNTKAETEVKTKTN